MGNILFSCAFNLVQVVLFVQIFELILDVVRSSRMPADLASEDHSSALGLICCLGSPHL